MLGNFLYYIIALLVYSTYQPSAETGFQPIESLLFFLGLAAFFFIFTWMQFKKIEQRIDQASLRSLDHLFHTVLTRQSILALLIYAIDIYALKISHFLYHIPLFKKIPTLEALIFLTLFIAYLSIVWWCAYNSFTKIYQNGLSRKDYVLSNISFSIPVILPWLFLSVTSDIINILPFETPKRFLISTEGQIIYFMFFLFIISIIGPVLIQKFWGCRPLRFGAIRHRIESLCRKANMPYRDIMVWPLFGGRMITAGVMGLIRQFRYILVTPALMRHLDPSEIDAVIAHEIGHIKKNHLSFYLAFFAGYLVVTFTALDLILYAIIYAEATYGFINSSSSAYATLSSISFSLFMIILFLVYFRYIFGYFMRNFERQADLYAYSMMGDAQPLISTFEKITVTSGQSPDRPNWHHFSIKERIDYLRACENDSSWIDRHNTKIRISIAAYITAIFLVGWAGYKIHYDDISDTIKGSLLKKMIHSQIDNDRSNPDLHQLLGDIYFSENNYEKAILVYKKTLKLDHSHVRTLNNLAWLYATCDNNNFRHPEKALELALHAASLSEEPHVMDTLAEAYYVNGNYSAAIQAEQQAILKAKNDHAYYQQQIEKFRSAERDTIFQLEENKKIYMNEL
ncbi:MAG: M48 family metalloprotease [Desulfobacteraceae bacterium]|nr:M48 family metalloprotease [Desulfobacteraceae bacterium]MBC2755915.1 M48 family metalloprotease [Desulfobacteraceae bacterium]